MIKYFSTFSGIWAFEYAIKKLWLERKCVWFSEIDKHAIKTYNKHYQNHKNYWDITKINTDILPNFWILVGGSPCQSFSITGSKKWFDDYRWNLFFDYIRILKEKQPDYFIFENVRGILTNNKWKTFKIITNEFDIAWYNIKRKVLNSENFWVAQNRPRVFIIWQKKSLWKFDFDFPIWINNKWILKNILEEKVDKKYYVSDTQIRNWYKSNFHSHKSQFLNKTCCCLTVWGNQKRIITNKADEFIKRYYNKQLNENELNWIIWRKLTIWEYLRLQGFPDWYTNSDLSNTQKYKQISNSINIDVLKEILKNLDIYIKKSKKI